MRREQVFAGWARKSRQDAGYGTMREGAEAAGVSEGWLRTLESGHSPNPGRDKLEKLAAAYGVEVPEISPTQPDEEIAAAASLVLDAYQRGLREGLRIARGDPE